MVGPGRVAYAGLQQSRPTREPNLDPRRETMCLLYEYVRSMADSRRQGAGEARCSPNVRSDNLAVLSISMREDVLNQVVAILVA